MVGGRGGLPRGTADRRRAPARLRGGDPRRRRHRRPGREPGAPPGRAQGPRPAADHRRSVVHPALRRGSQASSSARGSRSPTSWSPPSPSSTQRRSDRSRVAALRSLHACRGRWRGDASRCRDGAVVGVWAGYVDQAFGIAVDVGSTTIAGHLCDLFSGDVLASGGRMNPQIRFGEDLMSRVSYVMMNPGGDRQLTVAVRQALDELAGELLAAAGAERDQVLEVVLVGNPIMHHLVLGIDPDAARHRAVHVGDRAARSPDPPGTSSSTCRSRRSTPGRASPVTSVPTPRLSCSRRGRTAATRCSSWSTSGPTPRSCSATASASSPRRARPGRRSRAPRSAAGSGRRPGRSRPCASTRHAARPGAGRSASRSWSDEPGFAGAVAATGVTGLCGSGIIDLLAEMYLAGVIDADGTIAGANAARSADVVADGRTFRYVFYRDDRNELSRHPERRPRDPARQGRAARRHRPAGRARRPSDGDRHPPRRGVRRAHRPAPRDGPRPRPGLSARRRPLGRQCRRRRSGDRAAVCVGTRARWSTSCAASRRSRPPPSRVSRSCSSRRWRSPTRRRRPTASANWSTLPARSATARTRRRRGI